MLELISNTRLMNALGAAICAGMMGFALISKDHIKEGRARFFL